MKDNLSVIDILSVFSVILQLYGYESDLKSSSNDDIIKELQKQNKEYLEKIISNQQLIIDKLTDKV